MKITRKRFIKGDRVRIVESHTAKSIFKNYKELREPHLITETIATSARGTTGQWVRTEKQSSWVDASWFEKFES